MTEATRLCGPCGRYLPLSAFYTPRERKNKKRSLHWKPCRECSAAYKARAHKPRVDMMNALKLATGCMDCGYMAHVEALEYDHRPGEKKIDNVSAMVRQPGRYSWDDVLAEIAKCDLVCANCHRVRTTARGDCKARGWDLRKAGIVPPPTPTDLPEQLFLDTA